MSCNWTRHTVFLFVLTNLLDETIYAMKKNTDAVAVASQEVQVVENTEKTKYMFTFRKQKAGQNHGIKDG